MSADNKLVKYFKGLSRRQKIVWIVAAVLVVVMIAGGITAAVLLTRDEPEEGGGSGTHRYFYAIAPGNSSGFYINDDFTGGADISEFEITAESMSNGLYLSDDLRLSSPYAEQGMRAEYVVSRNGYEIALIEVLVTAIDEVISDAAGLVSLDGRTGVYALGADIDVSGLTSSIRRFSGTLYGNHHTLTGLRLPTGVFAELSLATVTGVEIEADVSAAVGAGSYGALAARAVSSDISYCSVRGTFQLDVSVDSIDDAVAAGGIAGYVSAGIRNAPYDVMKRIYRSETDLDMTVSSGGLVRIGSVAGVVLNAEIRDTFTFGTLRFGGSASYLSGLFIGGIAGIADKNYGSSTPAGGSLDESGEVYSYTDIDASVEGGSDLFAVETGGVYGRISEESLANTLYAGTLRLNAPAMRVYAGGITGRAVNETTLTLRIRGVTVTGSVTVYTLADAFAGGVAGVFDEVDPIEYSSVFASVTPVIETDTASVTGIQKVSDGVGNR